ncbi:hypothetical protein EVAR_50364_1 [Eumeta japonica]|uniref:Uncharacterized protein n=1 Tax=Eumeta variegata TaxID=151549 RepID=A0A4C1Y0Z1_EUMVA|nr:hypothetical protein EVAR_50364_1 [Eumeta japonica]
MRMIIPPRNRERRILAAVYDTVIKEMRILTPPRNRDRRRLPATSDTVKRDAHDYSSTAYIKQRLSAAPDLPGSACSAQNPQTEIKDCGKDRLRSGLF